MLKDPKHPMNPGYITDDDFRSIKRCLLSINVLAKPVEDEQPNLTDHKAND